MRFVIAVVASALLALVALVVMVGPSALTGLLSSHETATTNIHPIVEPDKKPIATTTSVVRNETPKVVVQATTTAKVAPQATPQPPVVVPSKTPTAVAQPAVVASEETPEVYFQKAIGQYSALVSAELKKENSYPKNSTGASVTAALHTVEGQQVTAVTFSILKIEEYKVLHGAYPSNFTLKISMPLVTTEYAFTRSADGNSFTLCQNTCIDSKNGFEYGPYAPVLMGVENIQSLFDKKWIAQAMLQGRDEIIMSSLKSIRAEAELKYNANKSFVGICASTALNDVRQASLAPEKVTCSDSTNAAAAEAYLPYKEKYFCVDTTGYFGESAKSKGAGTLSCPQS